MMKIASLQMSRGTSKENPAVDLIRKILKYKNNYFIFISAYLLSSSNLAGGEIPFGAAFFAAALSFIQARFMIGAAVVLGAAIKGSPEKAYINAASMILYSILSKYIKSKDDKVNIKAAGLLFAVVLLPQFIFVWLQGFLVYDILKSVFSSFIAFILYLIFRYSIPVLSGAIKKTFFTGEETISIAITAALILTGLGAFRLFGFSVRSVLSVLLLLFFSYRCGAGVGAAAGAGIGLITSLYSSSTPSVTGVYALCGMLAGILAKLGKTGSALGFIMGNMILAAYLNGAAEAMLYLREIIAAVVIFFIIPDKLISRVTDPFKKIMLTAEGVGAYAQRIRNITVERLDKFSKAFINLSKTFDEIAGSKMMTEKQDINVLFDRVADRICSDCSLREHCWDRNFYDTYQAMFKVVESLESKGRVEESDIPAHFFDKCARISDFVNAVNNMYELFRVGIVWKSKLLETRSLISRQFKGMSHVISSLACEINDDVSFMGQLENEITAALHKAGVKAEEVIAYENNQGMYEVYVTHDDCKGARICVSIIEKIVSGTARRRMIRENGNCSKSRDGSCCLKLTEAENLHLTTGIARAPKYGSSVSGDSFTFMDSGKSNYMLALSDGMGSGYGAESQSKATINILESFLESGFDKDMAVSLVNSILVLKSDDDSSCTIDLSQIDLFSGKVEFIKIGAAPTYIKKKEKVDIIRSASLPAGILPGIDAELAHRHVSDGDMIIMVTDGVIDSFSEDVQGDRELMKLIQNIESLNPQQIADAILIEANKRCGGKPCDDLTVLVAKVWEEA